MGIRGWLAFPGQAGVFKEGWEREFPLYPGRVQQEADGEGVQETGTQALPEGLQLPSMDDLQSTRSSGAPRQRGLNLLVSWPLF